VNCSTCGHTNPERAKFCLDPRAMRACSARWARPSHTSATPEGAARFPGCRVDDARGGEARDLDE
jgi:hypothetical protein